MTIIVINEKSVSINTTNKIINRCAISIWIVILNDNVYTQCLASSAKPLILDQK
jgi:hypothetical protein